jgi:hypothetical protein
LRKGQKQLEQQLERLTEAYLGNVIPLPEYQRRRAELERRQAALTQQAQQLQEHVQQQAHVAQLTDSLTAFCQRTQASLTTATFEQRRQLVELLIDRVVVTGDQVEIRYAIPTGPAGETIRFCHLRTDYFNAPDLIRARDLKPAQQIRIDPVGGVAAAQIGTRRDSFNPHLVHVALDGLAIDLHALVLQVDANPARAVERIPGVDLVDPMFHSDFLWRRRDGLVVQTGSTQTEQISLRDQRQFAAPAFYQRQTLNARQGRDQIFF